MQLQSSHTTTPIQEPQPITPLAGAASSSPSAGASLKSTSEEPITGLSTGAKAGIAIAAVAVGAAVILGAVYLLIQRKAQKETPTELPAHRFNAQEPLFEKKDPYLSTPPREYYPTPPPLPPHLSVQHRMVHEVGPGTVTPKYEMEAPPYYNKR